MDRVPKGRLNVRMFCVGNHRSFSVSVSQLDTLIRYLRNQEHPHRGMTFQEEFLALLKKHRIEFDERYLWD